MTYKPRLSDRVHDAIADKDNAIALGDEVEALEQRLERLETGLGGLSDPMAYEHIGKFHGRKLPWAIAKEALTEEEA